MKKGFTLIELLVAISIIAILATLLMANMNATRSRARDAQRKTDLRNIQTALRMYYNDYRVYPNDSLGQIAGCGDGTAVCSWGGAFETDRYNYMSVLPNDPLPEVNYIYDRVDLVEDDYTIMACLENPSDDKCSTDPDISMDGCDEGCVYMVRP